MLATVYIPLWTLAPVALGLFWLLDTVFAWIGAVWARVSDWWFYHFVYPRHFSSDEWD